MEATYGDEPGALDSFALRFRFSLDNSGINLSLASRGRHLPSSYSTSMMSLYQRIIERLATPAIHKVESLQVKNNSSLEVLWST